MKYKYNGNWEDLSVKALDSMPVGTQVEYTGTTIPVGWEEVNDYSTTEVDTGKKWIDGSTIYRKVISVSNQRIASNETISHGISSLGTITSIEGIFYDGTTYKRYPTVFMNGATLEVIQCDANSTNITFNGNGAWGALATRTHTFVLEYTKSS